MPTLPRSILFVCTGNICRSPLAEGVFRHLAPDFMVFDSAGLGDWHVGDGPDRRSTAVAARHGIDISGQICRVVTQADFDRFDVILGMDSGHVQALGRMRPLDATARVGLFMEFCRGVRRDVPDPYHGGPAEFQAVYGMVRTAAEAWIGGLKPASSGQDSSMT